MPNCSVSNCKNYSKKTKGLDIHYYRFPRDAVYCNRLIDFCRIEKSINFNTVRICSVHFTDEMFSKSHIVRQELGLPSSGARVLKFNAVPTIHVLPDGEPINARIEHCTSLSKVANLVSEDNSTCTLQISGNTTEDLLNEKDLIIKQLKEERDFLEKQNQDLQNQIKNLQNELNVRNDIFKKYFTLGQVTLLLNKKTKVNWSAEDISAAISLRSVSPKAYRYLRNVKKIPLPSLFTLRNWVTTLDIEPGILQNVLYIMKYQGLKLENIDKLCILSFDEMHISNKLCIDKKNEKVVGPHTAVQVIMARGLFSSWKQIIYYDFDQAMTKEIIDNVVQYLHNINYTVVGIVSDLGGSNRTLAKQYNIGIGEGQNTFFCHPETNTNIYFFYDVPHILKLVRNNLIDSGFIYKNRVIDKRPLEKIINIQSGEIKIAPKLTQNHLDVSGPQRQNVKLAAQCLSHTVAQAIKFCGQQNLMPELDWEITSDAVKLFNDWFDIFNVRHKYDKK